MKFSAAKFIVNMLAMILFGLTLRTSVGIPLPPRNTA